MADQVLPHPGLEAPVVALNTSKILAKLLLGAVDDFLEPKILSLWVLSVKQRCRDPSLICHP